MSAYVFETFKAAGPILAVVLPAVAAYFAYRSAERKPASVGASGIVAIGGALADQDGAARFSHAIDALAIVIGNLSAAVSQRAATERRFTEQFDSLTDEIILMRRAIEEVSRRLN